MMSVTRVSFRCFGQGCIMLANDVTVLLESLKVRNLSWLVENEIDMA